MNKSLIFRLYFALGVCLMWHNKSFGEDREQLARSVVDAMRNNSAKLGAFVMDIQFVAAPTSPSPPKKLERKLPNGGTAITIVGGERTTKHARLLVKDNFLEYLNIEPNGDISHGWQQFQDKWLEIRPSKRFGYLIVVRRPDQVPAYPPLLPEQMVCTQINESIEDLVFGRIDRLKLDKGQRLDDSDLGASSIELDFKSPYDQHLIVTFASRSKYLPARSKVVNADGTVIRRTNVTYQAAESSGALILKSATTSYQPTSNGRDDNLSFRGDEIVTVENFTLIPSVEVDKRKFTITSGMKVEDMTIPRSDRNKSPRIAKESSTSRTILIVVNVVAVLILATLVFRRFRSR